MSPQRYIYDAQALRAFRARRVINVQYPTSFFVIASRISTTSSFLTRQGSMTRMHLLNHHGLDLLAHHDVQGGELAPAPPKRLDGPYR